MQAQVRGLEVTVQYLKDELLKLQSFAMETNLSMMQFLNNDSAAPEPSSHASMNQFAQMMGLGSAFSQQNSGPKLDGSIFNMRRVQVHDLVSQDLDSQDLDLQNLVSHELDSQGLDSQGLDSQDLAVDTLDVHTIEAHTLDCAKAGAKEEQYLDALDLDGNKPSSEWDGFIINLGC